MHTQSYLGFSLDYYAKKFQLLQIQLLQLTEVNIVTENVIGWGPDTSEFFPLSRKP